MPANASSSAVAHLAQNSLFEQCARVGYVVSGLLHLIIGYIAIRIAMGGKGGTADQSGALAELAGNGGGSFALWTAFAAFSVMAMWRLAVNHPGFDAHRVICESPVARLVA